MKKLCFLAAIASIASAEVPNPPPSAETILEAIQDGSTSLSFRPRHENVSDKRTTVSNGNVLTVQTQMGYKTKSYYDFSFQMELTNVSAFLTRRYNPRIPQLAKQQYAEIPDPKGAKLTLGFLQSNFFKDTSLRVGRQQIDLDNSRFIGSRKFRQTPQSFDGITLFNNAVPRTELFMGYITRVNSPWALGFLNEKFNTRHHLLNMNIDLNYGKLAGFLYLFSDRTNYFNSSRTYGTRFNGQRALGQDFSLMYDANFALQKDKGSRPKYTAIYHAAKVGVHLELAGINIGYETLNGNKYEANKKISMPYGNAHEFLGWADIFEFTPDRGIKDLYASIFGKFMNVDLELSYHNFRNQEGFDRRIGKEIDFKAEKQINDIFWVGVKYAKFISRAENLTYDDKKKVWVSLKARFK